MTFEFDRSNTRFLAALSHPCARHAAEPGQPCWLLPDGHYALCGARFDPGRLPGRTNLTADAAVTDSPRRRTVRRRTSEEG